MAEIWFAGGGTGGHLVPGLALAQAIFAQSPGTRLVFRHAGRPVDEKLLSKTAWEAASAGVPPLRMRPSVLYRYGRAYFQAKAELTQPSRSLVVGLGGYASFPHVKAAQALGIPTLLIESNAVAGKATRYLLPGAWKAVSIFEPEKIRGVAPKSASKFLATGLPIRPARGVSRELARASLGFDGHRPLLLIAGGSQGARAINAFAMQAAPAWAAKGIQVLHLAGAEDAPGLQAAYERAKLSAEVHGFLHDMELAYAAADAALCRAGGATLAELAAFRLPSILVPFPHAADDHQAANALLAETQTRGPGGSSAIACPQAHLGPATLDALDGWLLDPARRAEARAAWEPLSRPAAAEGLAGEILAKLGAGAPLQAALA